MLHSEDSFHSARNEVELKILQSRQLEVTQTVIILIEAEITRVFSSFLFAETWKVSSRDAYQRTNEKPKLLRGRRSFASTENFVSR